MTRHTPQVESLERGQTGDAARRVALKLHATACFRDVELLAITVQEYCQSYEHLWTRSRHQRVCVSQVLDDSKNPKSR